MFLSGGGDQSKKADIQKWLALTFESLNTARSEKLIWSERLPVKTQDMVLSHLF